jgi:hypothetical protein
MSNLKRIEATHEADPYIDPVSYLAALGIDAELVSVEENTLGQAA